MSNEIKVTENESFLSLQFNRPQKKNAITLSMYHELNATLEKATQNEQIKALHITGSNQIFTSGNDISDFLTQPDLSPNHPAAQFLHLIANFKKPIIASIHGLAIGIGTTLLLHCDLIYATPNSSFQLPFIHLGLTPEGGSSYLLPYIVGHAKAAELLLLGETFDAESALKYGLINEVIPEDKIDQIVIQQISKITKKSLSTLIHTKQLLKSHQQKIINQTIQEELQLFAKSLTSPEAKQAFAAFLSK